MEHFTDDNHSVYTRNSRPVATTLLQGSGVHVYDATGKAYIDCCSQTLNLNLGQCHPEVSAAVIDQIGRLTYASSRFANEPAEQLAHTLVSITPPQLSRVNLKSTSGSSANECAIKAARKRTGKNGIFSFLHSHHGQTTEMMRVSGKHFMNAYLGPRGAVFLPTPAHDPHGGEGPDTGSFIEEDLETLWQLQNGDVAAVIVEPVLVDAGIVVPSKKFLTALRSFCTRRHVALIFDEVQTGFGWLGTLHAMDYFGVVPDMVSFGKSLGAGFPLAATLVTEEFDVLDYGEHELTFGAHPVSCAASLKMIEILRRPGFLEGVREKAQLIEGLLTTMHRTCPVISTIRGVGLIWGIELKTSPEVSMPTGTDVVSRLLDEGVILRTSKVGDNSNVLQIKPPLIISEEDIALAFSKISGVLSSYPS
jgi:4-aminobutyrate aminotransferase